MGIFTLGGPWQESLSTVDKLSSYGPGELGVECVCCGGETPTQQRTRRLEQSRDNICRCPARVVAPFGGGWEACLVAGLGQQVRLTTDIGW